MLDEKGFIMRVVFFHQRLVLRFQLLNVDGCDEREEVAPDDFIQEGQVGLGSERLGAFHCGLGKLGQVQLLDASVLGIEDSGAGVIGVPEKSLYLLPCDGLALLVVPNPRKGFHQPLLEASSCATADMETDPQARTQMMSVVFIRVFVFNIASYSEKPALIPRGLFQIGGPMSRPIFVHTTGFRPILDASNDQSPAANCPSFGRLRMLS